MQKMVSVDLTGGTIHVIVGVQFDSSIWHGSEMFS